MRFLSDPAEWPTCSRAMRFVCLAFAWLTIVAGNCLLYHVLSISADAGVFAAANVLVNPNRIAKETARLLVNNLKFMGAINRAYSDEFKNGGFKPGATVNARLPQRYRVGKGQAINMQPIADQIVPISITDQANIGIEFSMESLTLQVERYKERYIQPAVAALVNTMDLDGLQRMYQETYWTTGTPGVVPGSTGTLPQAANIVYLNAGTKLDNAAVPDGMRVAMLSPDMHANLVNANTNLFGPRAAVDTRWRKGQFSDEALGIDEWFKTQNVPFHTVGAQGGVSLTDYPSAAFVTGASSLVTDTWTASVVGLLKKGDVFQIAGVRSVNPMSYTSTNQLMDFVVTADVDSSGAGAATIPFAPPLYGPTSGALQNVTALPANNAAITVFGAVTTYANVVTQTALVFDKDAYAAVMVDLELPQGVWAAERISNKALAVSVRFVKAYNIMTDQSPARVDVAYGYKAVRPEMGARIQA